MIQIENVGQAFPGIILGPQIFLLMRAERACSFPRVMNPANQVIIIVFLSHPSQIGGKSSSQGIGTFANRMTAEAAAGFQQFFTSGRISRLLTDQLTLDPGLPDKGGNGLALLLLQAKGRHFCGGAISMRIFQPDGNPFSVNLHPNFFQARTHLFLFSQETLGLNIQLLQLVIHSADTLPQSVSPRVEPLRFLVISGCIALLGGFVYVSLSLFPFSFQLVNHQTIIYQGFCFRVKSLKAMAPHAAFASKDLLAGIEHRGML